VRGYTITVVVLLLALGSSGSPQSSHIASGHSSASPARHFSSLDSKAKNSDTRIESGAEQQQDASASTPVIDRIEFLNNRRIRSDTLQARIFSRAGDPYNEETLKRDFQALWNTQFFEDVRLRVEDSPDKPNAKIVIFVVQERPVIRRIRYDGIHSVSESDILDRFKERKVGLSVESQFDPTRIKKAEVVLKDLLGEHGRQFAKVTPQFERIAASNAVILVFKVDEGPKVKVGQIKFTGNHAFSDRKLIRAMRHDRPYAIPLYLFEINVLSKTYDREKLNEDLEIGIRGLYQDNGYSRVLVKDPILENKDTRGNKLGVPIPLVKRSHGKAVNITIPIEEGDRYYMGTLKIVSADPDKALSLKVDALKSIFPLKTGDLFSVGKIRKALEDYRKAYGEFGFIDFTAEPEEQFDEDAKKINLTMKFSEEKQYYVRRIEFSGNTTTRDKVIRRQLLIDEGQLFNNRYWELSLLRLNQLDYFDKIEADKAVEIKRNTKDGTVDLNLKLKEKGKQSIGLQGGVSGLAGSFIGLTYQTNNFLGLGETLTLSAQFGDLTRSFSFGFTEPYLFDRPISTGFTIFTSQYKFDQARQLAQLTGQASSFNPQFIQDYNQNSTGFTIFASYPPKKYPFARFGISYGLTRTSIKSFNQASTLLFESLQFRSITGPSALNGIVSSTITPTITYNTVDNPVNSTRGKSLFYSLSFSGGPLGGNVNTITNAFDFKYFRPVNKRRNVLGLHFSTAYTTGYGGKEVPPFSRFYAGGESDIRGYDIRSISPVTFIPTQINQTVNIPGRSISVPILVYTATLPGGDYQGYGNVEYRIPIAGPVTAGLFFDGGTVGVVRRSALALDQAGFNSLTLSMNNIPAPFPTAINPSTNPLATRGDDLTRALAIAPGTNFRLRGSTGIEFVVQLPIVQAPFRIYYAYNVHRIHEQLFVKTPYIDATERAFLNTLPADQQQQVFTVLNPLLTSHQGLNYFEPKTTFRFTVSRTF